MFTAGAFGELITGYFRRRLPLYLFLIMLFVTGLALGAIATQKLSVLQKSDLTDFLANIYASLGENKGFSIQQGEVIYHSIVDNVLKTSGLMFVLGLSVIGAPLILAMVFLKGFVLGFTVGFLVQDAVVSGLLLSTTSVLPQNLLAVPAILVGAAGALSFAIFAFKKLLGLSKESIYGQFASTTFLSFLSSLLLILGALVEFYVTPVFVQLTHSYLL